MSGTIHFKNFDFRLKQIQEVIDGIADAIYYQNALRAQELKGVVMSVGYIRADLEGAAKIIEAQPETAGHILAGVAPTTAAATTKTPPPPPPLPPMRAIKNGLFGEIVGKIIDGKFVKDK